METLSISFIVLAQFSVLTVPMRNGNLYRKTVFSSIHPVLTVPMRNGNPLRSWWCCKSLRFLPYLWGMETYYVDGRQVRANKSSYRTYEEWKLGKRGNFETDGDSSYRTYEEWKLRSTTYRSTKKHVLTVPMRNGNPRWHAQKGRWWWVLTVPMRNGNLNILAKSSWSCFEFLPYLWGMETTWKMKKRRWNSEFLPYLWGMETRFPKVCVLR